MISYRFRKPGGVPARREARWFDEHGWERWYFREFDSAGVLITQGQCDAEDLPEAVRDAALAAPRDRPYVPWCDSRVSNP
jgi:hypothetical protein